MRQYSVVIVQKERVRTSAEARGRSATRKSVGVQYSDPVPMSDAEWREIQLELEESDDSDIDDEDGDLYLEEWDDY